MLIIPDMTYLNVMVTLTSVCVIPVSLCRIVLPMMLLAVDMLKIEMGFTRSHHVQYAIAHVSYYLVLLLMGEF